MFDGMRHVLALGRRHWRGFLWAALLISIGTLASLFEPWIYRAVVDDIAGVFVARGTATGAPAPPVVQDLPTSIGHLHRSGKRIFHAPLRRMRHTAPGTHRKLERRTPPEAFATIVLGAVLLLLLRWIAEFCALKSDRRVTVLSNRIETRFILDTFGHVLRLPLSFFSRRASGSIARQIDQSDHVAPVFTTFSQELWPDLFRLVAILGIVLSVNRELGFVALAAVPAYAFVSWRMSRRLETHLETYYSMWDEVSGRIQETLTGIKTVIATGMGPQEHANLERSMNRANQAYLARGAMQNRYAFAQELIVATAKAAALLLGGIKALEHQLTPGDVVLFLAYLDQLYDPIQGLTSQFTALQENASAVRRAQKLLAEPVAPGEELPPYLPGPGALEFRDVGFSYRPGRPVLDGVTFRIAAGQHVGIVGPSGAGKTTLTDLLAGLQRPQRGQILIDGQDVTQVAPSSLRRAIRGVSADGMLFRTSLAENVLYGRPGATRGEMDEAVRRAGLESLLERLPDGLDTPVGERGAELSAGERQRVLLARAFLAHPVILVLDEATANLDFRTEASVKFAMQQMTAGRTTLVIAHRRSMLTDVDRVLVLREGVIEQDGTPPELAERPGYFRDMMLAGGRD